MTGLTVMQSSSADWGLVVGDDPDPRRGALRTELETSPKTGVYIRWFYFVEFNITDCEFGCFTSLVLTISPPGFL